MAEHFGRYWLQEKIGHGGMAEIFRATIGPDADTYAFHLAIKRLHPQLEQDRSQVDMFLTEADVAKFLRHPNLIRVYEGGMADGRAYIAMEYVWGHDLARLIGALRRRRMRFPSDLAIYITLQLTRALDYIHRARSAGGVEMELVHRDVTPSNIYLTFGGEVKLGDFGIARVSFLEPQDDGMVKGKAHYLPPEMLQGEPVSQAADLWGVAATLYEMLTTRRVYEDASEEELVSGMTPPTIVPVNKLNSDIDPKLAKILMRALATRSSRRPRDAVAFYRQLKLYLRDQSIAVDGTALARFVRELVGGTTSGPQPRTAPDSGDFKLPEYQVPVTMSPTQRYELRQKKQQRTVPIIIVTGLLVVAMLGFAAYRLLTRQAPAPAPVAPPVASPHPVPAAPPQPGATPATPGATPPLDFTAAFSDLPDDADDGAAPTGDAEDRFRALMHRGQVQVRRGRYDSAVDAFRNAMKLKPNHPAPHLGQANALLALQRYAEAEAQVYVALEKRARNPAAYLLLGTILKRRGNLEQARWAYQQCIDIDPNSSAASAAKTALAQF